MSTATATTECWRLGKPSGKDVWALLFLPGGGQGWFWLSQAATAKLRGAVLQTVF